MQRVLAASILVLVVVFSGVLAIYAQNESISEVRNMHDLLSMLTKKTQSEPSFKFGIRLYQSLRPSDESTYLIVPDYLSENGEYDDFSRVIQYVANDGICFNSLAGSVMRTECVQFNNISSIDYLTVGQ